MELGTIKAFGYKTCTLVLIEPDRVKLTYTANPITSLALELVSEPERSHS